jgi:hypothetical protein
MWRVLAIAFLFSSLMTGQHSSAVPAYCTPNGPLSASDLPGMIPPDVCDLRGRVILHRSVGARVPPPGFGVVTTSVGPVAGDSLMVDTLQDGTVVVEEGTDVGVIGGGSPPACEDEASNRSGLFERDLHHWRINIDTLPNYLDVPPTVESIRDGIRNITGTNNDCGFPDSVNATSQYEGNTERRADHNSSNCTDRDGTNTMDFGPIDKFDRVGVECTWFFGADIVESDVRLDRGRTWTNWPSDSCEDKWDIAAVMTHERGHTYGLQHVSEENHGRLTMSRVIQDCNVNARTLGKGDVRGLELSGY